MFHIFLLIGVPTIFSSISKLLKSFLFEVDYIRHRLCKHESFNNHIQTCISSEDFQENPICSHDTDIKKTLGRSGATRDVTNYVLRGVYNLTQTEEKTPMCHRIARKPNSLNFVVLYQFNNLKITFRCFD